MFRFIPITSISYHLFSTQLRKMADLGVLDVSEDDFMITHHFVSHFCFLVLDRALGVGYNLFKLIFLPYSRVWWFIYF